ncbi:DUF2789 domain-containing protein [Pseudomonas sp. RL_15y_Pfl2_60]|uniref:DUF2789 domain-containing protein n=1 Tax=Pseudomonas sp. RL_15y_Pfl2_60 TaxID=3088709 RepID=UPI0030D95259
MEPPVHDLPSLFAQLGLDNDPASIEAFISTHSPLPEDCVLAEASFWNKAQAALLREEIREDADWAEIVDQLNLMLRG